jgi:chromosome segregation ATPase
MLLATMNVETYKQSLEEAKKELAATIAELGETEAKVQELGDRLTDLRQTVAVLSKLCGVENVEVEDSLGLTDAIRKIYEEGRGQNFNAHDIRLQLEARGFQTRRYGNLLASIYTVISRLEKKKEIRPVGTRGDGKPTYQWVPPYKAVSDAPPPPKEVGR